MNEDLRRQRRNLMAVSSVLWLFAVAGVERVDKANITGFGVSLDVERPGALFGALWVLFAYFLYRFCVFLADEPERVRSGFLTQLHSNYDAIFRRRIVSATKRPLSSIMSVSLDVIWRTPGRVPVRYTLEGNNQQETMQVQLSRWDRVRATSLAVLRFILLAPYVSDVILPLCMAAVVGAYAARASWGGNLSRLASQFF